MKAVSVVALLCLAPSAPAQTAFHWSFDGGDYTAADGTALAPLRQAAAVAGVAGDAVSLSRLDALRCDACPDLVGDGTFAVSFWLKASWASRRHGHGDVLNFVTADPGRPALWRIGFPSTDAQVMPAAPWPLVLSIGGFSTAELPVDIEPQRWTHVGFVGDGERVGVYRNGGLIGYVGYPRAGLPDAGGAGGALQVNGSFNYSLPDSAGRQGVWECELRLDELRLSDEAALPPVEYPAALERRADTLGRRARLAAAATGPRDRFVVEALLRRAEQYDDGADTRAARDALLERVDGALARIDAGLPPLGGQRGHLKLSYRSPVDRSEQPYEVYVPESWDGKEPTALVVALHGSTEDETVYFERYSIEERAEEHGWIVATPYGRGQRAYRDAGGRDVMDVVEEVKRQWPVDDGRVFVTGHSMGGMGCVALVRDYPGVFAAAAPVAGYAADGAMAFLAATPFLWVVGDGDGDWATGTVERMASAAAAAGAPHRSLVLEGYDHGGFLDLKWPTVVEATLPRVFAFFAEHRSAAGE